MHAQLFDAINRNDYLIARSILEQPQLGLSLRAVEAFSQHSEVNDAPKLIALILSHALEAAVKQDNLPIMRLILDRPDIDLGVFNYQSAFMQPHPKALQKILKKPIPQPIGALVALLMHKISHPRLLRDNADIRDEALSIIRHSALIVGHNGYEVLFLAAQSGDAQIFREMIAHYSVPTRILQQILSFPGVSPSIIGAIESKIFENAEEDREDLVGASGLYFTFSQQIVPRVSDADGLDEDPTQGAVYGWSPLG